MYQESRDITRRYMGTIEAYNVQRRSSAGIYHYIDSLKCFFVIYFVFLRKRCMCNVVQH